MQTNILDWLEATAARCPDAPAVGDVQQDYTWAQLAELARRSGSALAARTAPRYPRGPVSPLDPCISLKWPLYYKAENAKTQQEKGGGPCSAGGRPIAPPP